MGSTSVDTPTRVQSSPADLMRAAARALAKAKEHKRQAKWHLRHARYSMEEFAEFKARLERDGHQVVLEPGPEGRQLIINQSQTPQGGDSEHDGTQAD